MERLNRKQHMHITGYGTFTQVILLIWSFLQLFPLYWLIVLSFKDNQEIFSGRSISLPSEWHLENYDFVFRSGNMGTYLLNSFLVTIATILLVCTFAIMASFAISRMRWRHSSTVESIFILGITVPIHAALLPTFLMLSKIGLLNTRWALILPYTAFSLPMAILICNGLMRGIPQDIDEAAYLEGCNISGVFFRMIVPLMKPAIATVSIFTFLHSWNELLFAQILINDKALKTLTAGIQSLVGEHSTNWGPICAALAVASLPTVIAYLFMSKQVQKSMIAGSIKA